MPTLAIFQIYRGIIKMGYICITI